MAEKDFQPFPNTGVLSNKLDYSLKALKAKIGTEHATVYCYVIATVRNQGGIFLQTGSAPNFQGDLVTLCTCKRFMRTFLDIRDWENKWVAGFTGLKAGNRHNALVYLMKVGYTFESHLSFWTSSKVSEEIKLAKATNRDRFGDIYQPKDTLGDCFDYGGYFPPLESHVHHKNDEWHKDIGYEGCKGRKAVLLAGDTDYSFLWRKPMIMYDGQLHRGQKRFELKDLLENLKTA